VDLPIKVSDTLWSTWEEDEAMADVVKKKGTSVLVTLLGCLFFSCGNYQPEMIAYCREIHIVKKEKRSRFPRERQNRTEDIALSGIDVSNEYKSPCARQEI